MYNQITLIGRLGKDPETTAFEGDNKVTRFSLATSKKFKDKSGELKEKTQWHNVVAWNKLGDVVARFAKRGHKLHIEGEVEYREYEKDGEKKYITEVVATAVTLLEGSEGGGKREDAPPPPVPESGGDLPF